MWDNDKKHNENAEWLGEMKKQSRAVQKNIIITREMMKMQCRKIPLWKAPGLDGVQGFWLKKLTSPHERIAVQLDDNLNSRMTLPEG